MYNSEAFRLLLYHLYLPVDVPLLHVAEAPGLDGVSGAGVHSDQAVVSDADQLLPLPTLEPAGQENFIKLLLIELVSNQLWGLLLGQEVSDSELGQRLPRLDEAHLCLDQTHLGHVLVSLQDPGRNLKQWCTSWERCSVWFTSKMDTSKSTQARTNQRTRPCCNPHERPTGDTAEGLKGATGSRVKFVLVRWMKPRSCWINGCLRKQFPCAIYALNWSIRTFDWTPAKLNAKLGAFLLSTSRYS